MPLCDGGAAGHAGAGWPRHGSRSLLGQLGHVHGWHRGHPGPPRALPEELDFVASQASAVVRKGALLSHFVLCAGAFAVGNRKEWKCKE